MKFPVKKILGVGLAFSLAALNLSAQSAAQFGNLPLWFEAGSPNQFTAHASESEFTISSGGAAFALAKKNGQTANGQLQFVGANRAARIFGSQQLTGTINYLFGSQPDQWRTGVPTYGRVQVENIYPGVNVIYYGNRQKLEYDLILAAGVNPSVIALRFDGAENISLTQQGELVIHFPSGDVRQHPPVAYQTIRGERQEIAASYKILDAHTAAFALGTYQQAEPLVIDPVLTYSTYFGGNDGDIAWAVAVNPVDGSMYVAGSTFSTKNTNNQPTMTFSTTGAYQTNYLGGKATGDAFIARFDNSGTNLLYATYLGGSGNDGISSLAVDDAGNAFLAGYTDSTNFPTTNALYPHISGKVNPHTKSYPEDAFVAELNPGGNALVYSTYLGGNSMDAAFGLTLDESGDVFVTGYTFSTNFPVTLGTAYQPQLGCSNTVYINANAFVAEISVGGSSLNYSTFLGGTNFDKGRAIAYNNGKLFVAGYTASTNFPTFNAILGTNIVWTNHLSKKVSGTNQPYDVVITNYFTGDLLNGVSTNKDKKYYLADDAFVTAFTVSTPTNLTLLYSTFLGGTNGDQATGIAADSDGNAYVSGFTTSTNFPDTVTEVIGSFIHTNTDRNKLNYVTNGFLTKIQWDGTNASFGYSAMFGGKGGDVANGVVLDADNNAYVIGTANSTNYPTYNTYGDLSPTNHYIKKRFKNDVVVTAFNADASALLFSAYLGGYDNDYGNAIAVDPVGNLYLAGQTISTNFPTVNAFQNRINDKKKTDMFVAKITQFVPPVPNLVIAPVTIKPSVQSKVAGAQPPVKTGIHLQWQMFPANYAVESSSDMSNWQPAPVSPTYSNGWYHVVLPTTNSVGFFRLHKH